MKFRLIIDKTCDEEVVITAHQRSALIDEIEEPLDEFDDKLFEEIIVEMSLNNTDELTITLLGGLKFTELI